MSDEQNTQLSFNNEEGAGNSAGDNNDAANANQQAGGNNSQASTLTPVNPSPELVELGQILSEAGFTKDNIAELLQSRTALQQISQTLESDPMDFYRMLERSAPETARRMLERMGDLYVEQFGGLDNNNSGNQQGGGGSQQRQSPSISPDVRALRDELNAIKSRQQQEDQRRHYETAKTQYYAKVDEYMNRLPSEITSRDRKAINAMLHKSIAEDNASLTRINQGIYVDIPKHLQKILNEWTQTTEHDVATTTQARTRVENNAARAAGVASAAQSNGNSAESTNDDWETGINQFARDLTKARQAQNRSR